MHSAQTSASGSKSESGYKKDQSGKDEGQKKFSMPPPNPKAYVDMIEVMELVGSDPEKKNWKGIIIAVLVILVVFSLITVAVVLVMPVKDGGELGEPVTFEDIFSNDVKPKHFDAKWISDKSVFVYRTREGEVMVHDTEQNTSELIMDNSTFRQLNTDLFFVSEDLNFVLIAHNIEKLYRHSFLAEYKIYNRLATDPTQKLIQFPQGVSGSWHGKKLQYAGWSNKGQALTFVYDNDLYYQSNPFTTPSKLTSSGSDAVMNGIPDWLYEEEIFHGRVSHWFNPKSSHICYTMINDSRVPTYTFPWYGDPTTISSTFKHQRYPKAGIKNKAVNPETQLFLANIASLTTQHTQLNPPDEFKDKEHYVTLVRWLSEDTILVVWSNRAQNHSIITLCDLFGKCYKNLEQKSTGGWVEIPNIFPIDGGIRYLALLPQLDYKRKYHKHVAVVTTPSDKPGLKRFITLGSFDVTDLVGYDVNSQLVYFISTNGNPRQRHLFSVAIPNIGEKIEVTQCLTCNYSSECTYSSAVMSNSADHYILQCMGPGVPFTLLRNTLTHEQNEILLENNTEFKLTFQKLALPIPEFMEIKSDDGYGIWIKVLLPPVLNKKHITLYPMLVHTYAAPGTQQVTDKFQYGWETYLVSQHNVICVFVDGRGSGAQGEKLLYAVYKQLGGPEVRDQITAAQFLRDELPFVDKERIAIWGWSYGGFVTSHAVGNRDNDVFGCGIAVAPVTDWRYYDTAYTERYMGLAGEPSNYRQYDKANVSSKAEFFKGKKIMLVHGTADDNVHFQHTAQLIRALTVENIDYRVQTYTDKSHALSGTETTNHLYKTMTQYLRKSCWNGGKPRELRSGEYVDVNFAELAIR